MLNLESFCGLIIAQMLNTHGAKHPSRKTKGEKNSEKPFLPLFFPTG
jgi:hypothetical protein